MLSTFHDFNGCAAGFAWLFLCLKRERVDGRRGGKRERRHTGAERHYQSTCRHGLLLQNLRDALLQQTSPEERRRRGKKSSGSGDRDRQQRFHVAVARIDERKRFLIDHLLARKLNLSYQPPDGGVEPQNRSNAFSRDLDTPVTTPHVDEFVAGDRVLHRRVECGNPRRKHDDWTSKSKRDRARYSC